MKDVIPSGGMCKNCSRKELIQQVQNQEEQSTIFNLTQEILKDIQTTGCIAD